MLQTVGCCLFRYIIKIMTTIKLRFRPSSVSGKEGTLYYQVIHLRKVAVISTAYHIHQHEWDDTRQMVDIAGCTDNNRKIVLQMYVAKINWEMERMRNIVDEKKDCCVEGLLELFRQILPCASVFCYIRQQIAKKMRMGCYGTAKTYISALRSFERFRNGNDLGFANLTGDMMQEYEAWMLHTGLKRNSASCYIRTFRTLYRLAVEEGLAVDNDIFRKVHVSVGKTRKRAVSQGIIHRILCLDLAGKPSLDFARDIFMFSFYTRGMSFVDIAHLRKRDLHNGFLTYNRRKTFQCLTIQWERPMQSIVDKYSQQTAASSYLFPIINGDSQADRRRYEQTLQRVNRSLKKIGVMIGLSIPLSTYVARHSWASIARNFDVPLSVISEGLGHDSDRTTQIYLASLDTSMINKANKKIISKITSMKNV